MFIHNSFMYIMESREVMILLVLTLCEKNTDEMFLRIKIRNYFCRQNIDLSHCLLNKTKGTDSTPKVKKSIKEMDSKIAKRAKKSK